MSPSPIEDTFSGPLMDELPSFMVPAMMAMGLGSLPASQPMVGEINASRSGVPQATRSTDHR